MPNNQRGAVQFVILGLLAIGLVVGLYLVGQKTNLLPKAYDSGGIKAETSVSCVTGKQDTQLISVRWNDIGVTSYQVEIKEPTGNVGLKCVGRNTSYTFEGEYSTAKNYTAYVYGYNNDNCSGGLVNASVATAVSNAVCTAETANSLCQPLVNSTKCGQPSYDNCVADCQGTTAIYKCTTSDYRYTAVCGGTIECAAENRRCDERANNPLSLVSQAACNPGSTDAQVGANWQDNGAGSYQLTLFSADNVLETKCLPSGTTSHSFGSSNKYASNNKPIRMGLVAFVDDKCTQTYPGGAKFATIGVQSTCDPSATGPSTR